MGECCAVKQRALGLAPIRPQCYAYRSIALAKLESKHVLLSVLVV